MLLFFTFSSCDEVGDIDVGGTSTENMAGDWYVQLLVDGEDIYGVGYYLISTYNTSANTGDEMWIDDHETWPMKVKATVNTTDMTISGTSLENLYSYSSGGETISPSATITNGSIVKDGAETSGGNQSDLISFNVEYADDPGTIYTIVGYKRTGFAEDEH